MSEFEDSVKCEETQKESSSLRVKKKVTFDPETKFVERRFGPPVIITHTIATDECVLYGIQLSYMGRKWNIGRRFSQFVEVHKQLVREGLVPKAELPTLPKKRFFKPLQKLRNKIGRSLTEGGSKEGQHPTYEREHVFERKCNLELYLFHVCTMHNKKLMAESEVLRTFLEVSSLNEEANSRESNQFNATNDAANFTKMLLSGKHMPKDEDEDADDTETSEGEGETGGGAKSGGTGTNAQDVKDMDMTSRAISNDAPLTSAPDFGLYNDDDDDDFHDDHEVDSEDDTVGCDGSARSSEEGVNVLKAEHKEDHVSYRMKISLGGRVWTISRRYKHIAQNHKDIIQEGLVSLSDLPQLPKRRLFSIRKWTNKLGTKLGKKENTYEEDYVRRRQQLLEEYIGKLFASEILVTESQAMQAFFELPSDAKEAWGTGERFNADFISMDDLEGGENDHDDDDGGDYKSHEDTN